MIYASLKEKDPRLSLGTVYRNLALLTQTGEVRRIRMQDEPDRFDGDTTEHYHYICRRCRRIIDIRVPELSGLPAYLAQAQGEKIGTVEQILLNVSGLCRDCCEPVKN